jgi:Uncharacterized conserved protein
VPSRWAVTVAGVDATKVKLDHVHAVVSGWFDDGEEGHRAKAKPYTVQQLQAVDGGTLLEIGLLVDELGDRLASAAAPGSQIRLGSTWTRITHPPEPVAMATWQELTDAGRATSWCLRFLTPTTFRRGNSFTPAPTLSAILGSLRASWREFAPPTVPPLVLDLAREPVWVTDIDVTSQVVSVKGLTVSGFTGRLRFVCDGVAEQASMIDRLVRLAPYAGVGAYTTRGFGVTRPEPTWPQAVPRRVTGSVQHRPLELVSG